MFEKTVERVVSIFERIALALERIASAPATGNGSIYAEDGLPPAPANLTKGQQAPAQTTTATQTAAPVDPFAGAPAVQEQKQQAAPNREEVGKALVALAVAKGREVAVGALAKFSATELKQVKESDYSALLAEINKAAA